MTESYEMSIYWLLIECLRFLCRFLDLLNLLNRLIKLVDVFFLIQSRVLVVTHIKVDLTNLGHVPVMFGLDGLLVLILRNHIELVHILQVWVLVPLTHL